MYHDKSDINSGWSSLEQKITVSQTPKIEDMVGFYKKYTIINNETGQEVDGDYFVLKPEKDIAAQKAILAYADTTDNSLLADDLRNWIKISRKGSTQNV